MNEKLQVLLQIDISKNIQYLPGFTKYGVVDTATADSLKCLFFTLYK